MSMYSTRGHACGTVSQSILWGLSYDGGLYVPSIYPQMSMERLASLCGESYQKIASRVLRDLLEDYSISEIEACVENAYTSENWENKDIVPLTELSGAVYVAELFHGPTLAFKDIALSILPYFIRLAADKNNEKREISIMVATSGDTGKAALEGFKNVAGTSCTVFYPLHGVSKVQQLQMITTDGNNTHVIGVNGNFDDTQTAVKKMLSSNDFRERMNASGKLPSSANSINFGRLIPQIVYYFTSYINLVKNGKIRFGQEVNFVVPTGNFGDILAGYYAKNMGLPIRRLICASNRNNVLTDFFNNGTYYANRCFYQTMSPSMDILISSNLERLLFDLTNRDASLVSLWMNQLKESGSFCIGTERLSQMNKIFSAGYADDMMTAEEIKTVFERTRYLMDPHTAVASRVLRDYRLQTNDHTPSIILATASPYKFAPDVLASLENRPRNASDDFFACSEKLEKMSGMPVPRQIRNLVDLPVRHQRVCEVDDMQKAIFSELGI